MAKTYAKKKKFTRKRNNKKNIKTGITRSLGFGFPEKVICTHKYSEQSAFTPATGVIQSYHYKANGLFDPTVAIGGHQPYWYDQLSAIYQHYVVMGSKIKLTVVDYDTTTANGNVPMVYGVYVNDNTTTTPASYTALQECSKGSTKWKPAGSGSPGTVTCKYSAKKMFGNSILANSNLKGSAGADPVEDVSFTIWGYNAHGATTANLIFNVDIEYIVMWFERKDVAGS